MEKEKQAQQWKVVVLPPHPLPLKLQRVWNSGDACSLGMWRSGFKSGFCHHLLCESDHLSQPGFIYD